MTTGTRNRIVINIILSIPQKIIFITLP